MSVLAIKTTIFKFGLLSVFFVDGLSQAALFGDVDLHDFPEVRRLHAVVVVCRTDFVCGFGGPRPGLQLSITK